MPAYRAESCGIRQPDDIKQEWLDLQDRSDCSYFQSWGWIGTWLDQIAIDLQPVAIKVWSDDTLVGIGLFVSKNIKRHIIIGSRAINRFDDAEIQLLKVHNGHDEIGYLYNFAWRRHVYVLQTGF